MKNGTTLHILFSVAAHLASDKDLMVWEVRVQPVSLYLVLGLTVFTWRVTENLDLLLLVKPSAHLDQTYRH